MIQKAVLRLFLLFLYSIAHSAFSQNQNRQSMSYQSPEHNMPQRLHNIQKTGNTFRVSICKCKEYMGEDNLDNANTKEILGNINIVTENVKKISEENTSPTKTPTGITTNIYMVLENIETSPETTKTMSDNFEQKADDRDTLTKVANVTDTLIGYSENEEQANRDRMQTNNMTLDMEDYPDYPVLQIIGGQTTMIEEFPHMAAIGWKNSNGSYSFDCGGSLISPKFVLTAAHCTYSHIADNPAPEVVRLGDHSIDGSIFETDPIQVRIKEIHKHPQYTRKNRYNDIALLELDVEVKFGHNIQPACLWSSKDLSPYSTAVATGWGAIDSYSGERPNKLQKASLHLLSNEKCNDSLGYLINKKWDKGFIESQLCAGEPMGGKDTCQGDSGSPLQVPMLEYSNRYYLIGITSFGPKICAQLPAVYTRVSSFLDWIESIVWPNEYKEWLNNVANN